MRAFQFPQYLEPPPTVIFLCLQKSDNITLVHCIHSCLLHISTYPFRPLTLEALHCVDSCFLPLLMCLFQTLTLDSLISWTLQGLRLSAAAPPNPKWSTIIHPQVENNLRGKLSYQKSIAPMQRDWYPLLFGCGLLIRMRCCHANSPGSNLGECRFRVCVWGGWCLTSQSWF